ncbi:hypothetical protein [Streptomyces sp. NRRL S-31]|uniref:hypothetical protein n=1 Tax=Streptomyces sp. NRRL S-31 TaxID=1463898 RepID=UPI000AC8E0FE|nr:hypothetical protein [Streptomyces sp. NRRL S-31]
MLDDVDLGNRRLTIAGRVRPLDDLTVKLLLDWPEHRRGRWPNTANDSPTATSRTATKRETKPGRGRQRTPSITADDPEPWRTEMPTAAKA